MDQDTRHFAQELDALKQRLLAMGDLATQRVKAAMQALVTGDEASVAAVITGDGPVNQLHMEIDDRAFKLFALQQPMAVDLRTLVSVIKINGDLERVGDLAVNIAEATQRYLKHVPVKPLIDLPRMGEIAQQMLTRALDAFVTGSVGAAEEVMVEDDVLDALKHQVFRELLTYMLTDAKTIEAAIDLILISRHLERVGDHATNIAEDVIFIVEGRDVRHHARR
jgi:phosphate transport system protein